jgi:hypothetical protein
MTNFIINSVVTALKPYTPHTLGDWGFAALTGVCAIYGGVWGGIPAGVAYLMHRADAKPVVTPVDTDTRVVQAAATTLPRSEGPVIATPTPGPPPP